MAAQDRTGTSRRENVRPLAWAGVVLGLGFGGFFDGIVFHQVLQFHHMLSAHPDPAVAGDLELNVLWDGLFHVVTYLLTVAGVGLVYRAWRRPDVPASGRVLLGATIAGWGLFNVVEGTVNHFLLGIHHVWPDGPGSTLAWDAAFLAWGLAFLVVGSLLASRTDEPSAVGGDGRA
jgi:uncharacterized membrane protein